MPVRQEISGRFPGGAAIFQPDTPVGHTGDITINNLADPFFARLARGVEDVSRKQQYRLMVCSGGHDEEMEKAGLDFLVNQGCEAIVVHASRLPDKELLRYAAHFPALVVVG